jgi:tRNA threonylcarbamoyladenosine biosynthesis protein TsaB
VALSKGLEVLSLEEHSNAHEHAATLTLMIERVMKKNNLSLSEINAVSVSKGPGSYTALRIGISTAKGICFALQKPLIAVDTLQSLALAAAQIMPIEDAIYCPMIDARRMEVYCALYNFENNILENNQAKIIDSHSFTDYFNKYKKIIFTGNGAPKCESTLQNELSFFVETRCSARHLVPLAMQSFENQRFEDVAYFVPEYLKEPNITTPKKII